MSLGTLTDRLRGIVKPARELLPPAARDEPGPADEIPGGSAVALEFALGGEWHLEGTTRCYVVERHEAADAYHGRVQVGAMADALARASADAPLLANGAPARAPFVFFDLETTGLSGGAGTYAFLVGCAWFDERGAFVSQQHVLVRAADERPMLERVARRFDTAGALVSFNGRSFDAPLLETRFLYHRLPWTAGRLPHVDILHPARRFWRPASRDGELSSCSLASLERALLAAPRTNDVPGFEAPTRYFQFIRTGDPRPLAGVLEHNRLDLLSLAGLTARLLGLVNEGPEASHDTREAVALGRLFERAGLPTRAVESYERGLELAASPRPSADVTALQAEALRALAVLARRSRRYDAAAARWNQLLDLSGCPPSLAREAAEALAIHHEHRTRDLEQAQAYARRTLVLASPHGRTPDVQRRLARLDRKRGSDTQPRGLLQLADLPLI